MAINLDDVTDSESGEDQAQAQKALAERLLVAERLQQKIELQKQDLQKRAKASVVRKCQRKIEKDQSDSEDDHEARCQICARRRERRIKLEKLNRTWELSRLWSARTTHCEPLGTPSRREPSEEELRLICIALDRLDDFLDTQAKHMPEAVFAQLQNVRYSLVVASNTFEAAVEAVLSVQASEQILRESTPCLTGFLGPVCKTIEQLAVTRCPLLDGKKWSPTEMFPSTGSYSRRYRPLVKKILIEHCEIGFI